MLCTRLVVCNNEKLQSILLMLRRIRYMEGKKLIDLTTCSYKKCLEAWIEDLTLWPPVEISDIELKFLESTLERN